MCGIFGFVARLGTIRQPKHLATRLFQLSQSRGMEASGFIYTHETSVVIHKEPYPLDNLIRSQAFADVWQKLPSQVNTYTFLGHSRLATNGKAMDNRNNQPISDGRATCIHNGIIVNVDDLWKKYTPQVPRLLAVDTEIIPVIYKKYRKKVSGEEAIRHMYRALKGEASIALLPHDESLVYLATNTGSLYIAQKSKEYVVFASEAYILKQAVGPHASIMHLGPGSGFTINRLTIESARFSLYAKEKHALSRQTYSPPLPLIDTSAYTKLFVHGKRLNAITRLQKHAPNYNAIKQIKRCTRCILPETMPLIVFDREGVCNYCHSYTNQQPAGEGALETLIAPHRRRDGKPDCIVAFSGGRDSSYCLHFAKTVLKLNPIAYTYDWGMVTDIGRRNQSRLCGALGVEHVVVSANIRQKRNNIRKNIEAWLQKPDVAMVPLFMAGDKQAEFYVEELKRKTGITLILYGRGNQLEDERFKFGYYGILDGTPRGVIHNLSWAGKVRMATYFARACMVNSRYINVSLIDTAFAWASSYLMQHKDFVYLWHYIPWTESEIVSTIMKKYAWESAKDTVATWRIDDGTPPFYNYIYYHIQGFTEHDTLRSNQIREGHISRKDALSLIYEENRPRYQSLAWYFDTIGMDGHKALSIIDNARTLY